MKNHFEIYHLIGDPTLELWDKVPGIVRLEASIEALELRVTLNRCPEGAVVTVWHGKELMKRIEPRFTSFTIPLKETMLEELSERHVARRGDLSVCFGAPGHRFVEVKLRLPSVG